MNFFVNLALIFNQYVNPVGFKNLLPNWKFYTIYCCWLAVELTVVYFFYVETKGPTLEEVAKIFDGEDANVGIAGIQEVKGDIQIIENEVSGEHVEQAIGSHGHGKQA